MKSNRVFFSFALVVTITALGCDSGKIGLSPNSNKPQQTVAKQNRVPVHRFVITRNSDIGFDTQTGQICKTWGWIPTGKPKVDADGNPIARSYGEFAPTCIALYQLYPSGVETQSEAVSDTPQS